MVRFCKDSDVLSHEMIGFSLAWRPMNAIGGRVIGDVSAERSSGRIRRGKEISETPATPGADATPTPPLVRARAGPSFPSCETGSVCAQSEEFG
jgi:hypothetical protein